MVGLGSIDNTADTAKPVSNAQQTALDLKANLESPTFTGNVTLPATSITNTTVSTSITSGALIVTGGAGIGGNVYVGGNMIMTSANNNSTRFGYQALNSNRGSNNTGFGSGALSEDSGNNNTAVGASALNVTTGSSNTGIGNSAGSSITTGINNTVIGSSAGGANLTISGNITLIGANTGISANTWTRSTAIGYNSQITASNQIVLGTASETVLIVGTSISNSTATGALQVAGGVGIVGNVFAGGRMNAVNFNSTSDIRIKDNIIHIDRQFAVDKLRQLEPCAYSLIEEPTERTYGFIAQEIANVLPEAISLTTNYVPSIYELAFVEGSKITLVNKIIKPEWKKIKISGNVLDIIQVVDDKTFYVSTNISDTHIVPVDIECRPLVENLGTYKYKENDEIYTGAIKNGVFVYGHEINDFHMLDKDVIWAVTASATQELDRQLQESKQVMRNQDARILKLEEELEIPLTTEPDYKALGWGDTPASLNYIRLIPYLIKSIQELNAKIEDQANTIAELKSRL